MEQETTRGLRFNEKTFEMYIQITDIDTLAPLVDMAKKFRYADLQYLKSLHPKTHNSYVQVIKRNSALHKAEILVNKLLWLNRDCRAVMGAGFIRQKIDINNKDEVYALAILVADYLLQQGQVE